MITITIIIINKMRLPYTCSGKVIKGFGRGSKELGFPTANLDIDILSIGDGVYCGYAKLEDDTLQKMVMSIGNNPHYGNEKRSFEVHILKHYDNDFYGQDLTITICGRIRDMEKYNSVDELIQAINKDIEYAKYYLD